MATINYTMGVTPVGTANTQITLFAVTPSATLPPTIGTPITGRNTLTTDSGLYFLTASSQVLSAININNPTNTWTDAVYKLEISTYIDDNLDDITFTDVYFLKTLNIDAGITAYPVTTPLLLAVKNYMIVLRQDLDDAYAAADYTGTNTFISLISGILAAPTNTVDLTYSISLTAVDNIRITVDPTNPFSNLFSVYSFSFINTLDNISISLPIFFSADITVDQIYNKSSTGVYSSRFADGVYSLSIGVLDQISEDISGDLYQGDTVYLLVTTESDLGIALYQANYDPANATQVANLAQLLVLQALVLSEYAANDYAGANQALEDIFAILDDGINWSGLSIELTNESNFTLEFSSLPSGLYTDQTGVLTNTLNDEEYSFTSESFPEDNTDTVLVLNSETLVAGDEYADGVYQAAVQFNVDGVVFNSIVYGLVLTAIYCGFDKIVAKATTCKYSESLQMKVSVSIKQIINAFEREDYVTANKLIQDTTQMLNSTGCGCGCG